MISVYYSLIHSADYHEDLHRSLVDHRLSPKLLYASSEIAQVYEKILKDPSACPKHRKNGEYGQFLFSYLTKHIPEIKKHVPLGYVSLGVGLGDIEDAVLSAHPDPALVSHILVDYSLYFLEKTAGRLASTFPHHDISAIRADFVSGDMTQLRGSLRNLPKKQKIFLVTGEILSKYHPTLFLNSVLQLLDKDDYLFFDLNIFPSEPGTWLTMVKQQILKFSHQEYYKERIAALGFDPESSHLEFQLHDEEYNSFWNVYTRLLTFTAPQTIVSGGQTSTFYPGDTFSITKYHYFKERYFLDFIKKFPVQLVDFSAPLTKQPNNPLRWCLLKKLS